MITCERCGRLHPEVVGAPSQVCPHCGAESATPQRAVEDTRAADPVGAATHAARFLKQRYLQLLLLGLPVPIVQLVASYATQLYVDAKGLDAPVLTTGQQMQFLGVALPLSILVGAAWFAYWCVPAALLLRGEARSLLARWPQLLAVGFVLTLLYAAGLLLLIVPFFVFAHWFLHVPAALADRETTIAGAFEASRRFARERRTHGFTALVVMIWTATAILVFALDAMLSTRLGALGPAVWPLATWLLLPVVPAFPAAFWALAARAPVPEATPSAAVAAAREGSTTCPHCGEIIRYAKGNGGPVDVVCPACGRGGRVL